MEIQDYIKLLDWTGRQFKEGKKGRIPSDLAPILERLEIETEFWLETVTHFGSRFYHVAGTLKNMLKAASDMGMSWFKGKATAKTAFL